MEVVERQTGMYANDSQKLSPNETVEWTHDNSALRLVRVEDGSGRAACYRVEGHPDDNGTTATVEFEDRDRAALYAAVLARTPFRPSEDPAHLVPRELLNLPRRYQAAYFYGATTNSASWVAFVLSDEDEDLSTDTIYSYCSRVRSDYPELFPDSGA